MVITSRILQDKLGINPIIADYFANKRAVPANNLFWKDKRIYLSVGFGFLTIPFAFDLMHKMGLSPEVLLDEQHVSLMEEGFDRLKRYEIQEISLEEFTNSCAVLLKDKIRQLNLSRDLFGLFSGAAPSSFTFETRHKALARSDFFLFTLVDLDVSDEWVTAFLPYWYALARPILLLDDFSDLEEDRLSGEENTIIEFGDDKEAVEKAYQLGKSDLDKLAELNPSLAAFIEGLLKDSLNYEPIRVMLT
ncbi:MAG: hypothetical protein ACK5XN_31740 [Bacteroidota bacterium]